MSPWLWCAAAWAGAMDGLPSVVGEPGAGPWTPALGDFDGDGIEELLLGLPWADRGGHEAGMLAWIPEPRALDPLTPLEDAAEAYLVDGVPQANFGYAVVAPGDLDGDGYADFAAGAPNRSDNATSSGVVVLGYGGPGFQGSASAEDLSAWNDLNRVLGTGLFDRVGMRLYGAPDLNEDGRADLLLGTPAPTPSGTLSWGWLGLLTPENRSASSRSVRVNFGLSEDEWLAVGLDHVWIHRDAGSLAGRAAALLPDGDGDGRPELLLGAPGIVDPDVFDPYLLGTGAAYLFAAPTLATSPSQRLETEASAIGILTGSEPGDAFPWLLLGLADGRALATSYQADEGSGAVYLLDDLFGGGQRDASEAAAAYVQGPAWSLFGSSLADAAGLEAGSVFAAGAPGALSGTGSVFLVGESEGEVDASLESLYRLDGCWSGGQAGHAMTSTEADEGRVLAITAPFASVLGEQDGLVALVGPGDLAGLDEDCQSGDYRGPADQDGDGYAEDVDCDDTAAWIHPGAVEVCGNGLDDDCDGEVDEDCGPPLEPEAEGPGQAKGRGCSSAPLPTGVASLGLWLLALGAVRGRRARAGAAPLLSSLLLLGLSAPARSQQAQAPVYDAMEGAAWRLWGSDAEERLVGPVLAGRLTGGAQLDLAVANPFGIQGTWSAGEVQVQNVAGLGGLGQDFWLGHAAITVFGDEENITLGSAMVVVDEGGPNEALYIGVDHTGLDRTDIGELAVFRRMDVLGLTASNGSADLVLQGEGSADSFGSTLAWGGDLDGDGEPDLAIGSPGLAWRRGFPVEPAGCSSWEEPSRHSGAVYLVHGGLGDLPEEDVSRTLAIVERDSCAPNRVLADRSVATATIMGWDEDEATWLGWRLLSPGDLDGDGVGDLVVGSLDADLGGTVHIFTGPIEVGQHELDLGDASGSLSTDQGEAYLGWALAAAPDGGGLAVSSPWVEAGAGRVWIVDRLPDGPQDIDEAASLSVSGAEGSGFGYSLAWGESLLVGAPFEDRVHVLDEALETRLVLGGAEGLGMGVGFLQDLIAPTDGTPELVLMAPMESSSLLLQGVALILDGGRVQRADLPELQVLEQDDLDGDGVPASEDCDDLDPRVYPGAPETCDGLDNDCDGQVDEEACGGGCASAPAGGRAPLLPLGLLGLALVGGRARRARAALALASAGLLLSLASSCASPDARPAGPALLFEDLDSLAELDPEEPLFGELGISAAGEFQRIVLQVDGEILAVDDARLVRAEWSATSPGEHEVQAIGFDAEGQPWWTTQLLQVDPAAGDLSAPKVRLMRPLLSSVPAWTSFTIALNAADDHLLDTVSLSVDGQPLVRWSDIGQPVWAADVVSPGLEIGDHPLEVVATDYAGRSTTLSRTLRASLSPGCTLASPSGGSVSGIATIQVGIEPSWYPVQEMQLSWLGSGALVIGSITEPTLDEHGFSAWSFEWDTSAQAGTDGVLQVEVLDESGEIICTLATGLEVGAP
jgi:hypothetical protein